VNDDVKPAPLYAVWNKVARDRGLVVAQELTKSREKLLWNAGAVLTKAGGSIAAWERFLNWLADDPFNRGEGNASWKGITLDFLVLEQHLRPRLECWHHEAVASQQQAPSHPAVDDEYTPAMRAQADADEITRLETFCPGIMAYADSMVEKWGIGPDGKPARLNERLQHPRR
jgi:hypothetical protein